MNTRPCQFTFLGERWTIRYFQENALEPRYAGQTCHTDQCIHLLENQTEERKKKVMLHELLHMISTMMGQPLSEEQTIALEQGLFTFMHENPEMHHFIFNAVGEKP